MPGPVTAAGWSRRDVLRAGAAATALTVSGLRMPGAVPTADAEDALSRVRPRDHWTTRPPTGPITEQPREDVRLLIVHHSATGNGYRPEDVPGLLRGFQRYHIRRGFPDIAYNFLVDRFGTVWEGRAGSLNAPVAGGSSDGAHGYAQLACWIGHHRGASPEPAAVEAMIGLLAALAATYDIDPLAEIPFTPLGSSLWKPGVELLTPTIISHREMSDTECPGDAAHRLVTTVLPKRVAETAGGVAAAEQERQRRPGPRPHPGQQAAAAEPGAPQDVSTASEVAADVGSPGGDGGAGLSTAERIAAGLTAAAVASTAAAAVAVRRQEGAAAEPASEVDEG